MTDLTPGLLGIDDEERLATVRPTMSRSSDQDVPSVQALVRPILQALASIANLESTYLTVFDWDRRQQEVRYVFSSGDVQIAEGHRVPLPAELTTGAFAGVTRSLQAIEGSPPDSWVAKRLGLKTYVSVPVTVSEHRLFGMLCGASRHPREITETEVSIFQSFADVIAEHIIRIDAASTDTALAAARSQLLDRALRRAETEHRLKTPLTVIQGMSLTLHERGDALSAAERTNLEAGILRNVGRLSAEVEQLLLESRKEVRGREMSPVTFDLAPMIREIASAFDGLGTAHTVIADIRSELSAYADSSTAYQVLGDLLDNAIKYSPDGGQITIHASQSPNFVQIEVADEGIGIPQDVDVFAPFRRGDLQDEQTPGVGLGLHIVRGLVSAMEGDITARQNDGAGSTFIVRLPRSPERKTSTAEDRSGERRGSA